MTDAINATPNTAAADWEANGAAHDRLRAELRPLNRTALFSALAAAGVTRVVVSFDGYGDSGQIENVEVKAGDATVAMPETQIEVACAAWGQAEPERSLVSVASAIEALAYDLLGQAYCGWENNEGAYGQFTFGVRGAVYHARLQPALHRLRTFATYILRRRKWDIVIITPSLR